MTKKSKRLSNACLVIRFNEADPMKIRAALDDCWKKYKYWGLSFAGRDGLTAGEIVRRGRFPSDYMQITTVAKLRAAGFTPIPDGGNVHISLRFKKRPTDGEIERLCAVFDDRVDNPHPL